MSSRVGLPIWQRLTITCVTVALIAVAIVAALSAALAERYIDVLVHQRQDDLTHSLLTAAKSTYATGKPGWFDADLRPALNLAAQSGTDVAVLDNRGDVVASTFADPAGAPGTQHQPIVQGSRTIGTLYIRFNGHGLVQSADDLRRSLLYAELFSAAIAALVAVAAAVVVSRRVSTPVHQLTAAAGAMSRGNRGVRLGEMPGAPSDLQELATTFDGMADTLARQEQLRRDLVADVAHELRTPVAVLQANCEALLDGVVAHTPEQTASLHEETVRLASMVEDLQALASAEAAALQLSHTRCDLGEIVGAATNAMSLHAQAVDVTLTRELEPVPIDGDCVRIHQVTTNLLSNALKFTPPGGSVHVRVCVQGDQGLLVVSDTGIGIAPEDLPHVRSRFWRSPAHTSTPGTGIGLAIVSELVAAHGGTLDIASHPGAGTRVTVSLPLPEG
ncbi:MAG TPA: HAMP domain-containing sensor histidine kinase [Mycobacteriales bacterium]|nr:HAMP domain-containing sensor histidine kinase [Mycobacteriales bacterium]